jgi:hypothetical protein
MGIFGFLSKAHLDQTITAGDNTLEISQIDSRIDRQKKRIVDADIVIAQLDKSVQVLIDFDRIRGKDGAIAVRESQKEERANLNAVIDDAQNEVTILNNKRLELSKEQLAIEAEVGPLKYIAELIYGDDAKDHFDEAVRWVILLLIFVFDPLAVLLLIAANQSLRDYRKVKVENDNIADFTEVDAHEVKIHTEVEEAQVSVESKTEPETITKEMQGNEVEEVKHIISEDERELWEKFKSRKEWKEPNSGIIQHVHVEEKKKVEK